jgi:hypothetical protein
MLKSSLLVAGAKLLLVLAVAPGCTATIGDVSRVGEPNEPVDPGNKNNPWTMSTACGAGGDAALPPPGRIYRLTKLELQNTLDDLLGGEQIPVDVATDLVEKIFGFSTDEGRNTGDIYLNSLDRTAASGAERFRMFGGMFTVASLGPACLASDAAARTCGDKFIQSFGARAYRRPLERSEVDSLLTVYDAGRELGTAGDTSDRLRSGISWAVRTLLQVSAIGC